MRVLCVGQCQNFNSKKMKNTPIFRLTFAASTVKWLTYSARKSEPNLGNVTIFFFMCHLNYKAKIEELGYFQGFPRPNY